MRLALDAPEAGTVQQYQLAAHQLRFRETYGILHHADNLAGKAASGASQSDYRRHEEYQLASKRVCEQTEIPVQLLLVSTQ